MFRLQQLLRPQEREEYFIKGHLHFYSMQLDLIEFVFVILQQVF